MHRGKNKRYGEETEKKTWRGGEGGEKKRLYIIFNS